MANSNPDLSGSVNRLLAESKSRPTESITISEMSTRPAQKSKDFPSPIYSFQSQLDQQSSSIESLTKAIEKFANSQLTQQASTEHIHYGQSTETKSSRPSPTAGSSTERSVSKTNRPSCKSKRGHVEDQPSDSVTSSSELSSSSDGEDGWHYKRQKKQNICNSFANNRNVGPSDPEVTRLLIKQGPSANSMRPLGSAHVIDKSDSEGISNMIRGVQRSAEQSINPSDSDLVDNLIRHTMANASSLPGNTVSEDTTCAFLDSMNIKKEEKNFSPKIDDKLAQLVQQR